MLRRKDLIKEFELTVKQEIINHNRAVSEGNQKINFLTQDLEILENSIKSLRGSIKSQLSDISIREEDIKDEFERNNQLLSNDIRSLEGRFFCLRDDLLNRLKKLKEIEEKILPKEMLQSVITDHTLKFFKLEESLNSISQQIESIKVKSKKEFTQWKINIESKIDHFEDKLEMSNEKLDCLDTNIKGTNDLIKKLERRVFINEKKLENVYSLLDQHGIRNRGRE